MVLKLYTASLSTCGLRVATILHEKQVPYEFILIEWTDPVYKSEPWLQNQPFGQMPYIDDDGFILYESRAIARYIATKYASSGTPLLPGDTSDMKAMALFDQAVSVESCNFDIYASGIVKEKMFNKYAGLEPDLAVVERCEKALVGKLDGFERLLGKQKYMAGDSLTIVDFSYLPYGSCLEPLGYDYLTNETKYPNIARWWKEITSRPSWNKVKGGVPASL